MQDSLHDLLQDWQVNPTVNPEFRATVWGRIAERKRRMSYRVWNRTEEIIARPAWALAVIAAVLLGGVASGNAWRAHLTVYERAEGLNAYVRAVNPVVRVATLDQ